MPLYQTPAAGMEVPRHAFPGLIVGWVCGVPIPDTANVILSYAPFAAHVILHLLSTFTTNVRKRPAAEALDSLFYGSTQRMLVGALSLELNDCQLDIYTERCQLHWGRGYEFWLPGKNVLFSCVGFEGSVTFFFGWFISTHSNKLTQQQDHLLGCCCQDRLFPSLCVHQYVYICVCVLCKCMSDAK